MLNKLKFGDFIIIGVVLVMAGALAAALTFHSSGDKLYAEVWQNDTLIERVQLTDATDRTIKLDGNTIVLSGKTAKMADADCRDQVCVRTGTLTHAGQAAVCLPHRVVLKLVTLRRDKYLRLVAQPPDATAIMSCGAVSRSIRPPDSIRKWSKSFLNAMSR